MSPTVANPRSNLVQRAKDPPCAILVSFDRLGRGVVLTTGVVLCITRPGKMLPSLRYRVQNQSPALAPCCGRLGPPRPKRQDDDTLRRRWAPFSHEAAIYMQRSASLGCAGSDRGSLLHGSRRSAKV